ncbi:helix-turn-helix domain-containing protein [Escherichia coli]|uniref:helix-turn-helix domain-containing protein n=1 Tax=Escherichia coli TaxID=562 RepID=UPI0012FFD1F2|nr:helix-turn-helix domain-containing protein [Escherichia coli]
MNILPTAYAPQQGELLGKYELQKIDAIPEEVQNAMRDGLNDIRFNGYRWDCNPKTGWARVSPISSPANAEPESPEQSQADARADFLALQGEYLSVKPESKSEKKSATDIVNELRSKAAAKTSQSAPQQEAPEQAETGEPEQTQGQPETVSENAAQDDEATDEPEPDDIEAVRKYRNFKAEHYVNDRLFRDGLITVLKPSVVVVALFLGSKCGKSGVCFHSHKTIAAITGINTNTVKSALNELKDNGVIEIIPVSGHTNRYRLI